MDTFWCGRWGKEAVCPAAPLFTQLSFPLPYPHPTRYLETPIVSIWPLAMVGTFPNQTDQYYYNFPNEIKRQSLFYSRGKQRIRTLVLTRYVFHHVKKVKVFFFFLFEILFT